MKVLDSFHRWRAARRRAAHQRWLRKARVVLCGPNPRAIVYRKWNVPL